MCSLVFNKISIWFGLLKHILKAFSLKNAENSCKDQSINQQNNSYTKSYILWDRCLIGNLFAKRALIG